MTETLDTKSAFVKTYLTKELGSDVEIAIELPDAHVVRATGVVAGIRPERRGASSLPGMNVRFVSMSSLDEKRLGDYVDVVSRQFWSSPPPSILDA
jgi:Tfp pilus assembly protein PilZ